MTRILLVEDHELLRHGTRGVLEQALPGVEIGEAGDAAAASRLIAEGRWDLGIVDLNLPGRSGLELLEELAGGATPLRILVLSASPEEELAIRCLRLGAVGYLTKASAAAELVVAVKRALAGGRYVSRRLGELLAAELGGVSDAPLHDALSPRELQVLKLLAAGRTLREIGVELHLSEKTVATYRARIAEKLDISRLADLVRYAVKHGLIA
ncbi:MAG: response regulator transcription factor [Anaeromyxobacteraceae bacterium]